MDRGNYTCTATNFLGNTSATIMLNVQALSTMASSFSSSFSRENPSIDVRIAKQTVYGITLEWYTISENPGEAWYTLHFGKYDAKKEMIYMAPGVNSYSVNDLLPYKREKLIHIIIIVCAMVLAVPAGMYACTTETRLNCPRKCPDICHKKRKAKTLRGVNKESTFDSLPTGSDEGLCQPDSSDSKKTLKIFEDKKATGKQKSEHGNNADLY
uniref:Uncharacterized protein n=1 Tax=Sphaerodactylus townsendi TaxID=933632 RepID=A0ACB8F7R4_9SAUR